MTDSSRSIEHRRRHTAVALAVAAAVLALAIGGATGPRSDPALSPAHVRNASPHVVSPPAIAWSAARSPHPSAPPPGPPAFYPSKTSVPPAANGPPYMSGPSGPPAMPNLGAASGPTAAPSEQPSGSTATPDLAGHASPALDPPPKPGRFAIDLFEEGDFVSQQRVDWCVPASILTMMNMTDLERDRTAPTQGQLDRLARSLSTERLRGDGSEPEGWAGSLNELGYGPYEVRAERTRQGAIEAAARAIRLTGRPVGLLVWRGAHAWVMTGFRATADPAFTDDFEVTHVYVADPWHPRVSSIWGPTQPPNTLVPVRRMAEDYLAWRRPAVRYPEKDGRFVLVVPVAEAPATN